MPITAISSLLCMQVMPASFMSLPPTPEISTSGIIFFSCLITIEPCKSPLCSPARKKIFFIFLEVLSKILPSYAFTELSLHLVNISSATSRAFLPSSIVTRGFFFSCIQLIKCSNSLRSGSAF